MAKNKGGRPPLKEADRKAEVVAVRLTDAERVELQRRAGDQVLSDWIRGVLLQGGKASQTPERSVWQCSEYGCRILIETPIPVPPEICDRLNRYVEVLRYRPEDEQ